MNRDDERLPALYFDAECALCTRSAWFIDRRDRKRTLRLGSLQSAEGAALRAAHPELAGVDSLVWEERDAAGTRRVRLHSDAVLAVGRYLGGVYALLAAAGAIVPRPLRDAAYRFVARHRVRATRP